MAKDCPLPIGQTFSRELLSGSWTATTSETESSRFDFGADTNDYYRIKREMDSASGVMKMSAVHIVCVISAQI